MKKAILSFLSALLIFSLSACGSGNQLGIDIYRPQRHQDSDMPYELVSENVTVDPGINPLSFIVGIINAEPTRSEIEKPLPEGIYITGYEKQGETLKLEVSDGFSDIHGPQRALAEAALIMTFTDFSDIDFVSIEEGGRVIMSPRGKNSILFEDESLIIEK